MKVLLYANEKNKVLFSKHFEVVDQKDNADMALIIRSQDLNPHIVDQVIEETNGTIPVVCMTGEDNGQGKAYKEAARASGIPEEYILTGTDWRLFQLKERLQAVLKNPELPNPRVLFDEEGDLLPFESDEHVRIDMKSSVNLAASNDLQSLQLEGNKPMISVIGLSGGVGTSTVALSVMAHFKEREKSVLLIDTSKDGATAYHLNTDCSKGIHSTFYGDLGLTMGDNEYVGELLQQSYDLFIVDAAINHPLCESLLDISSHAVVVVNPTELDYLKLKDHLTMIQSVHNAVIAINKVDSDKPLRFAYVTLIENEVTMPVVKITDSEEVVSAFAENIPAYLKTNIRESIDAIAEQVYENVLHS